MILIFGGTTEGRLAIDVCEVAGKTYYYSTKSSQQDVPLHHGVRLTGAMTAPDIRRFADEHGVRCIIDAAHPFAEGLHAAARDAGLPVIRLERRFPEHRAELTYLSSFDEATTAINCKRLLALSGVNTIARLRNYWQRHDTIFRILQREESLAIAHHEGFPEENLIFYPSMMPSVEEEMRVMEECGCDAILTKESGESGGFDAKVNAALRLGLKVYVVEHPRLPADWSYVSGKHGLRRAIEQEVPDFFPLRTGLTTGACATAAAKAAMLSRFFDEYPEEVYFALPDGESIGIPVTYKDKGIATVVKEQNDDPDVTKGCRITATVAPNTCGDLRFLQGEGVGRVTLPGLGIPVGGPAINPTPRQMMQHEYEALDIHCGIDITISVEGGRELAGQTFNHKVGVVDGISIIGTSGIVSPLSNEAFIQSIGRELQVAKAMGCTAIGIASGKKGEEALLKEEPDLRVIHYGNFVGETLKHAHALGFSRVVLGIMIGKAVKLAEGHLDTHSHKVAMNRQFLREVAASCSQELGTCLESITMARELWQVMPPCFFQRITELCTQHCRTVFPDGQLEIKLIKDPQ